MGKVRDVLRNKDVYLTRKDESKATKTTIGCVLLCLLYKTKETKKGAADENETQNSANSRERKKTEKD